MLTANMAAILFSLHNISYDSLSVNTYGIKVLVAVIKNELYGPQWLSMWVLYIPSWEYMCIYMCVYIYKYINICVCVCRFKHPRNVEY